MGRTDCRRTRPNRENKQVRDQQLESSPALQKYSLSHYKYSCMHHGCIVGPRDNIGVHSGVSWIQIAFIPKV